MHAYRPARGREISTLRLSRLYSYGGYTSYYVPSMVSMPAHKVRNFRRHMCSDRVNGQKRVGVVVGEPERSHPTALHHRTRVHPH
jgi:hypothetical protein